MPRLTHRLSCLLILVAPIVVTSGCSSRPRDAGVRTDEVVIEPVEPAEPAEPTEREEAGGVADAPEPEADAGGWVEPFPNVRVRAGLRRIEVGGEVSPLIHGGLDGQNYYLEQFVCVPNTKEHESLVVTRAKPSHIHAALLLLGLEPGGPARWDGAGEPTDATGPEVRVRFRYTDGAGAERSVHPVAWTRHRETGEAMPEREWVFAGSVVRETRRGELYEADAAGTVVGLASFQTELLSWPAYIDDVEATGDLAWVARTSVMPPGGTPVTVVLEPAAR